MPAEGVGAKLWWAAPVGKLAGSSRESETHRLTSNEVASAHSLLTSTNSNCLLNRAAFSFLLPALSVSVVLRAFGKAGLRHLLFCEELPATPIFATRAARRHSVTEALAVARHALTSLCSRQFFAWLFLLF
jgi:hypothetical protein